MHVVQVREKPVDLYDAVIANTVEKRHLVVDPVCEEKCEKVFFDESAEERDEETLPSLSLPIAFRSCSHVRAKSRITMLVALETFDGVIASSQFSRDMNCTR